MRSFFAIVILLVLVSTANSQIIYQQDGPAAAPLPEVVQQMDDAEYAEWAEWHNALAERYAEQFNSQNSRYRTVWQTITSGYGNSSSVYGGFHNRGTGDFGGGSYGGFNTGGSSLTMRVRVKVPGEVKSVVYYNPYCKPSIPETCNVSADRPYQQTSPDWDNIFIVSQGQVVSVNEVSELLDRPYPKEKLYSELISTRNVLHGEIQ